MDFTGSENEAWESEQETGFLPEESTSIEDPVLNQDADVINLEDSTQPAEEITEEGGLVLEELQDGQLTQDGNIVTNYQENYETVNHDLDASESEVSGSPSDTSQLKDSIYTLVDKLQITNELLEKSAENTTELQDEPNILQVEEQITETTTYSLDDIYSSIQEMNSNLEYIQDYQRGSIENDQTFYRVEVATGLFIAGLLAGVALFIKFYG